MSEYFQFVVSPESQVIQFRPVTSPQTPDSGCRWVNVEGRTRFPLKPARPVLDDAEAKAVAAGRE